MDSGTLNLILDVVLVLASIWMVFTIRGLGGVVGRTLTFIVIGTVILGAAHLQATLTNDLFLINGTDYDQTVHRVVVLVGFIFLVVGFRQLRAIK